MKSKIILLFFALCLTSGTMAKSRSVKFRSLDVKEFARYIERADVMLVDVRTAEEYAAGHIPNAVNLDHEDVPSKAEAMLPDKDALILVYCRSGRRSKIASEELVKLGYTNVKEFGGIIDWPYKTVK